MFGKPNGRYSDLRGIFYETETKKILVTNLDSKMIGADRVFSWYSAVGDHGQIVIYRNTEHYLTDAVLSQSAGELYLLEKAAQYTIRSNRGHVRQRVHALDSQAIQSKN